ncbi:MAG TPA: C40 family peptidase [Streptosporangiaceae bacterium]|nr:C40 family peptidase [Streptosporangiaceae bacterium]
MRLFGEEFRGRRIVPVAITTLVVAGTVVGAIVAAAGGAGPGVSGLAVGQTAPSIPATPGHGREDAPVVPLLGLPRSAPLSVPVARHIPDAKDTAATQPPRVAPMGTLRQADLLIVAPFSLSSGLLTQVSRQADVTSAEPLEAARVKVNGEFAAVLGVNPSTFRDYAAKSAASSDRFWQGVAGGGMAVSFSMGTLDKLPLGGTVNVAGSQPERLPVIAFGTVGIPGVDAVVSDSVAKSLGMPAANAMVVSAPPEAVAGLVTKLRKLVPHGAAVEPLVTWVVTRTGGAVAQVGSATGGQYLSSAQLTTILQAALSRRGMPYVWGAAGPRAFDCSGLVEWAFAQAGLSMPRVAADQALTGPLVPPADLEPGDLLFYRTDPTDPGYVSHVALYLGNGQMIQAPQPGMNVEVVPVAFGSEFAGAVRVDPHVATAEATGIAG